MRLIRFVHEGHDIDIPTCAITTILTGKRRTPRINVLLCPECGHRIHTTIKLPVAITVGLTVNLAEPITDEEVNSHVAQLLTLDDWQIWEAIYSAT